MALVETLTADLADARLALDEARNETLLARERALDVREARLQGMAAEMAGQLVVGGSCPVCGSCDHPHKAPSGAGTPGDDDEKAAQKAADDAAATEHLRDGEVRDLATRLAAATERVDVVPPRIAEETSATTASLAALEAEAAATEAELAAHGDLDAQLARHTRDEAAARTALTALDRLATAERRSTTPRQPWPARPSRPASAPPTRRSPPLSTRRPTTPWPATSPTTTAGWPR